MSSLSEMPELVMENIIWFSDFRSVLTLRQVCKDFRNFIDDLNDSKLPDFGFSKIGIYFRQDIRLIYENPIDSLNSSVYSLDYFRQVFDYSVSEKSRSFNKKTTSLENSNIVDVAIRDLEQVMKFQKSNLDAFSLCICNSSLLDNSQYLNLIGKLRNMFEKLNRKIRTKRLAIGLDSQSEYMSILPFADPETLESLALLSRNATNDLEMNEIVKTEQWKKAKSIHNEFYALKMTVENICRLQRFDGSMISISARDLDFLKKTFITSSTFKCFVIRLRNFIENEVIPDVWGPAFHSGFRCDWYFRMKDSEEKVLRIRIYQYRSYIHFDILKMNDIPNRAIVHDYNEN
ncbi:unnamed protein product [Caenorhabditis nigoni]